MTIDQAAAVILARIQADLVDAFAEAHGVPPGEVIVTWGPVQE